MITKLDNVSTALFDTLISAGDKPLYELEEIMDTYQKDASYTFDRLMRIPAFAKLWYAMREAIDYNREMSGEKKPAA